MTTVADVIKAAMRLVKAVEFDVSGTAGQGGNGGLTSRDTIHAAGLLRLEISRFDNPRTPDGPGNMEGKNDGESD